MAEEKYAVSRSPYHPLKHLAAMRHGGFKELILPEIVHSNDQDSLYKVRGAWWLLVRIDLENAVKDGTITDKRLKTDIREFNKAARKLKFGDDTPASMRTEEEVEWANQFIDKILEQTGYANVMLEDLSSLKPKIE